MRVAVTGGSGHVGQVVVHRLKDAGCEVVVIDRKRPEKGRWIFEADAANAGEMYEVLASIRPEAVIHMAAYPNPYGIPHHRLLLNNVGATDAVIRACSDLGIHRVVNISSEQANGWSSNHKCPPTLPFNEDALITPANAYAMSKWMGEEVAAMHCQANDRLRVASLRINYVLMPEAPRFFLDHTQARPGMKSNLWGYVHAFDVADACIAAIRAEIRGHRAYLINARDSSNVTPTRELVSDTFGDEIEVAEWLDSHGACVDIRRARAELAWSPAISWRDSA
jgi:nucleoside-diphosphate-sugar epimerase